MNRIGISNFSWLIKFLFFFFLFKLNQLYSVIIIQTLGGGGRERSWWPTFLCVPVCTFLCTLDFFTLRHFHPCRRTFADWPSVARLRITLTAYPFSWIKFTEFVPLKAETFFRNSRMKTIVPPHIVFRAVLRISIPFSCTIRVLFCNRDISISNTRIFERNLFASYY